GGRGGRERRKRVGQEVDRLVVARSEPADQLVGIDRDELRRRALANRVDDAKADQLLGRGVDLRRRDARALRELVAVLRAVLEQGEIQPGLVQREPDGLEILDDRLDLAGALDAHRARAHSTSPPSRTASSRNGGSFVAGTIEPSTSISPSAGSTRIHEPSRASAAASALCTASSPRLMQLR